MTQKENEKPEEKPVSFGEGKKDDFGYRKKAWFWPSVLLALLFPFTVFVFGPFDIYAGNMAQFGFAASDFIGNLVVLALLIAVTLFLFLYFLRGKAFAAVFSVFFALSVMFYVQGTFLNFNSQLPGDGELSIHWTVPVFDTLIWIVALSGLILLFFLLKRKYRNILRLGVLVLSITLLGMQFISFMVSGISKEAFTAPENRSYEAMATVNNDNSRQTASQVVAAGVDDNEPRYLTTEHLTDLGEDGNVFVFVIDRFDIDYYYRKVRSDPSFFSKRLDGFVFYDNNIARYARTYPAVCHMLTGVDNDFSVGKSAYFRKAYQNAETLTALKANGYKINLFTQDYYGYDDASVFGNLVENVCRNEGYWVNDSFGLSGYMLRVATYRILPYPLKGVLGLVDSFGYQKSIDYLGDQPMYTTDMKDVYKDVTSRPFVTHAGGNFTFLHFDGCHTPNVYGPNFEPVDDSDEWNTNLSLDLSFKIIDTYLNALREAGLYKDATIIITGDHCAAINDMKDPDGARVTALFVKKSGEDQTPLSVSSAPVCHGDLWATIYASEDITVDFDCGRPVFNVAEDDPRVRQYRFQKGYSSSEIVTYDVVGDAKDFSNWTLTDREDIGSMYK